MKQQSYQICDASYDPLLRQFVREDGHVETIAPLEGKVFLLLLENTGECIERGLIFERCWGNVIVSEQALTNVISKIRKTLSRVTCGCATIRTVSKTGYSLEIDESSKPENLSSQIKTEVFESKSSSTDLKLKPQSHADPKALVTTETSVGINSASVADSELKTASNQEKSSAELDSSNMTSNLKLARSGYLIAVICVAVIALNLVQTFYKQVPYFIDKTEYRDSYTDNTNNYFFHIVRNEAYSLRVIAEKMTDLIPNHCNVDVFVRIYPSVDQPENDALYMLIQGKDGEALNYVSSIFNVDSSFDSFAEHMVQRSDFCD